MKPQQLATWRRRPIRTGPRHLLVTCSECQRGAPNELGWLRRAGWEQSYTGSQYRCGECAAQSSRGVSE
jgi:hypothetical protein